VKQSARIKGLGKIGAKRPLDPKRLFSAMPYSDDAKLDGILSSAKDFDMPRQTARIDCLQE
jgi:hypothetical protein